ncbi:MAG: type II toxin-antitoxin system RelE/ParE family toxin [Eggerthellaceae bacterium]|nr:type II toxin-antitoxin system RelE/ParE family toxin [Eggerthellaceae bacterium]MBQ3342708.1 type II toxin-antitoxin system RelE/ParE family toxin [Kiritimatiellia bacterium]
MSYRVVWKKTARKQLESLSPKQQLMVFGWVREHLDGCDNPKSLPECKKLAGTENGWRYRVGSYRLLAEIRDEELVIKILRVGHRQGVYTNLPKM